MAERIIMPKQGLQMTSGTITEWLVSEGGQVRAGEPLFEMETDKLTITIDAAVSGTLLKIVAAEGDTVPITELIAVVGQPGEDISGLLAGEVPGHTAAPADNTPTTPALTAPARTSRPADVRVLSTPRARTRADELGLSLIALTGSGPDGLIVEQDVLTAARVTAPAVRELGSGVRVPLSGMRGVIARRMRQSLEQNAQAVHKVSVRMDEAKRAIALMRERGHKIGYNAIIALATVRALVEHPELNAEIVGNEIWRKDFVNLGIAVAVPDGLMVPVVRDAHRLSLLQLSAAMRELADRARDGRLAPDDCSGGSFTLSNLGMLGLEEFTAIINPPEAGILAVGKVEDTPLAVDGRVEIHPVVRLTLSYDHRIVDGAPAALFLAHIKLYLETPPLMML